MTEDFFTQFKDYFKPLASMNKKEWSKFQESIKDDFDKNNPGGRRGYDSIRIFENEDIMIYVNRRGEKRGGMFFIGVNNPDDFGRYKYTIIATCKHDYQKHEYDEPYMMYADYSLTEHKEIKIHREYYEDYRGEKEFNSLSDMIKYLQEISDYREE